MTAREGWHWPRGAHPILVVDDDEEVRDMIVEALEEAGHPVISASNGAAALEQVRRHRPGLILLDLAMPVMDGRAFLAAYRQLPEPRAPVVVCTAHHDPVGQTVRVGADDYLRKPFVTSEVLAVVGSHSRSIAASIHWPEGGDRVLVPSA
jgi:CheY-like chemotaxis protein